MTDPRLDNVADVYPLSPTQAGMLFHTVVAPASGVYVGQIQCLLNGDLDVEAFQGAWQGLLERHPALRTAFLWDGLDEPLQIVRERVDIPWQVVDWRANATGREAELADTLAAQRKKGFDLSRAPLMRMLLLRLGDRQYRFVWTCHHLLVDGWSVSILLPELFTLYGARCEHRVPSLPEPMPYGEYIGWLKAHDREPARRFWTAYLKGVVSSTSLRTPCVARVSGPAALYRVAESHLSATLSTTLANAARDMRLTLNTLLHGAWAMLLHRYSDASEVVFGTTVSGRPAGLPGVADAVGLFINTLPVRVRIDEAMPLRTWLAGLQDNLLSVRGFEHTALADIQEWSDMPPGVSLFEHLLVFENHPPRAHGQLSAARLRCSALESLDQSNYPLALLATPDETLRLNLVYDPSHFADDTVRRMLQHLEMLLTAMPSRLDGPAVALPMLGTEELQTTLVEWNRTERDLPAADTVLDLIAAQCLASANAAAVSFAGQHLSYRELATSSDEVAHRLMGAGVVGGDPVALYLDRGIPLIVGLLGILKAGACYVPLDPNYPAGRIEFVLLDCAARVVLSEQGLAQGLSALPVTVVLIDNDAAHDAIGAAQTVLPRPTPDQPAYLIYTSGSTGTPKGVQISHDNLLASTAARLDYYRTPPTTFLLLSSIAFDSSVAGIFWSLTTGANLVLSEHRAEQDVASLADTIAANRVSHTLCLPSLYRALLEHADPARLASLRTVIVAGEAVPAGLVARHQKALPGVGLHNEYGPTEATVWCSVCELGEDSNGHPAPIGHPVANARIYILDSSGRPVPVGVPGELHVAGRGVATGYLNRPDATARKFVVRRIGERSERLYRTGDLGRHRADGSIEFLGRVDRQVKIRGHRIEPAEIEAALLDCTGVHEAIVLADRHDDADRQAVVDDGADALTGRLGALPADEAESILRDIEALPDDDVARMLAAHRALSAIQ